MLQMGRWCVSPRCAGRTLSAPQLCAARSRAATRAAAAMHELIDSPHLGVLAKRVAVTQLMGSSEPDQRSTLERLAIERGLWGLEALESGRIIEILLGEASLPDPGELLDEMLQGAPSQKLWLRLWEFFSRVRDHRELSKMMDKAQNILRGWPPDLLELTSAAVPHPLSGAPNPAWKLATSLSLVVEGTMTADQMRALADPRRLRRIARVRIKAKDFELEGVRALAWAPGLRQVESLSLTSLYPTEGMRQTLFASPWIGREKVTVVDGVDVYHT